MLLCDGWKGHVFPFKCRQSLSVSSAADFATFTSFSKIRKDADGHPLVLRFICSQVNPDQDLLVGQCPGPLGGEQM